MDCRLNGEQERYVLGQSQYSVLLDKGQLVSQDEVEISVPEELGRVDDTDETTRLSREEARRRVELKRLEDTLGKAVVRCQEFDTLLERLDRIWDDPYRHTVVERIQEMELTDCQTEALQERLRELDQVALDINQNARARLDRVVAKLVRALPPSMRRRYAYRDLGHRRKLRRTRALQTFERGGTGEIYASRLWECFEEYGDQRFLQALARDATAVQKVGTQRLLAEIDDSYWRMRVFESLIEDAVSGVREYAESYSWAFTYAVGRTGASRYLGLIVELAGENCSDPEFLGIYTWTLGQLGVCDHLAQVREWKRELEKEER